MDSEIAPEVRPSAHAGVAGRAGADGQGAAGGRDPRATGACRRGRASGGGTEACGRSPAGT